MAVKLKILFVEDVKTDVELIWREMEKNKISFSKLLVDNREDYLESIKTFEPDLIISDYSLPRFDGMAALLLRNELAPLIPFILVTGSVNEEVAVECMKTGADDYVLKSNLNRLGPAVLNSIRKVKLLKEKKAAEEELQKSEMMLQKAQAIAHVGNWELDLSLKTMWNSDEALRICGLVQENHKISYEYAKKIPLLEYRAMLDEALDRLLKYNEPYNIEFKIKRENDGAIRSVHSKAELIIEPDGGQVKVIGVLQDITDRKKIEKALHESEELYRNIFENVQDLYYETSFDGTIINLSPSISFLSQEQYSREDLIGKSMFEFYDDPEARYKLLAELKERGYLNDYEITLKNRDGSLIPCSLTSKIIYDIQGRPEKIVGSMRDITARKKAEEAIDQERRMLRTLIDNLPDPIYVLDKECRKVIANKADVENIGCANETEVLGKTDIELFPGKIGERGYNDNRKIIKTGKPIFDLEEEFISGKGVKRWLQTTKIPLLDKDGNISGLVGIGHDITERKQIIEELIRAKEKAEESDKLKTAFLHNISHEIRTPMNAIVGFSALLGEPDIDDLARKSYIEVIMQSSNHLLSIITDIVDISNIEANLVKTYKNDINVNNSLKSLCNQFMPKASEKKITLICETGLEDSDALIVTDSTKLNQILSNLVSNALKFTNSGQVKIWYRLKDNFLEFCVSDSGIGISPEHHARIFDRFYQIQNGMERLYEGTGLGLAISKAYVEHLGGKIWLLSEQGKGTSFFFTIPYEKQVEKAIPAEEKKAPDGFVFPVKKVILVAEDVESNYKLIKYFLSGSNAEVLHAYNGKEAVEKCLSTSNIDLILMDIKMPVMDGYTAVKLIREKNTAIPIIAQTAYADDREKAIECGCSGFISKPFDRKGLFKVLSEFI
ncbi:MAG: PAS domain S-box protein [Bacteroidales bacterium]|jgi:PAS domain S-box-containing protein